MIFYKENMFNKTVVNDANYNIVELEDENLRTPLLHNSEISPDSNTHKVYKITSEPKTYYIVTDGDTAKRYKIKGNSVIFKDNIDNIKNKFVLIQKNFETPQLEETLSGKKSRKIKSKRRPKKKRSQKKRKKSKKRGKK